MKREETFNELIRIAEEHSIDFNCFLGRQIDCGELCFEYNEREGFILFAYDRGTETYHYSNKDIEEFKYTIFEKLCIYMGFDYELKHRNVNHNFEHDDDLDLDTRKVAFEQALTLLNKVNADWMKRTISEYEWLLNMRRREKNVYFDINSMNFKVRVS